MPARSRRQRTRFPPVGNARQLRIDEDGRTVYALAESIEWVDETTLELRLRSGVHF